MSFYDEPYYFTSGGSTQYQSETTTTTAEGAQSDPPKVGRWTMSASHSGLTNAIIVQFNTEQENSTNLSLSSYIFTNDDIVDHTYIVYIAVNFSSLTGDSELYIHDETNNQTISYVKTRDTLPTNLNSIITVAASESFKIMSNPSDSSYNVLHATAVSSSEIKFVEIL